MVINSIYSEIYRLGHVPEMIEVDGKIFKISRATNLRYSEQPEVGDVYRCGFCQWIICPYDNEFYKIIL